jgi:hypothetical protein
MKEGIVKLKKIHLFFAIICILSAISILFYSALFQGKVIVPGDIVAATDQFFWNRTNQYAQQTPQNRLLYDKI